jgi:hypothetical protein
MKRNVVERWTTVEAEKRRETGEKRNTENTKVGHQRAQRKLQLRSGREANLRGFARHLFPSLLQRLSGAGVAEVGAGVVASGL